MAQLPKPQPVVIPPRTLEFILLSALSGGWPWLWRLASIFLLICPILTAPALSRAHLHSLDLPEPLNKSVGLVGLPAQLPMSPDLYRSGVR